MNAIISFIIALISGMGLGGGGLFAVYLALFTDVPQLATQGFNLVFVLFSAGSSVGVQLLRRRADITFASVMIASGLVGAAVGVALGGILPEELLRRSFGYMLIVAGILSYRAATKKKSPTETNWTNK